MTLESRDASDRRPLSTLLFYVLIAMLLPLGLVAFLFAFDDYHALIEVSAGGNKFVPIIEISLPIVLWLTALGLGWAALRALITVPLRNLQQLVEASGHDIAHARYGSRELATLAESIIALAATVDRHNSELDTALLEQQRLAREVHHRVKNSLQIVSSLLSLHARGLSDPVIIATYAAMQARISALTMVHRWIYDERGANGVDVRALVSDLSGALEASLIGPDHHRVCIGQRAVGRLAFGADAAIPIAFLITELASIAVHTSPPGAVNMAIAARREGDTVHLSIEAAPFIATDALAAPANHAAARIIHGMVRQLRTHLHHDDEAGRYSMHFVDVEP